MDGWMAGGCSGGYIVSGYAEDNIKLVFIVFCFLLHT